MFLHTILGMMVEQVTILGMMKVVVLIMDLLMVLEMEILNRGKVEIYFLVILSPQKVVLILHLDQMLMEFAIQVKQAQIGLETLLIVD